MKKFEINLYQKQKKDFKNPLKTNTITYGLFPNDDLLVPA